METLATIRIEHRNAPQFSAGATHQAMICTNKLSKAARKSWMGVSYWTPEQIAIGSRTNDDGSYSVIIAAL